MPDSSSRPPAALDQEPPADVLRAFFGDDADVARAFAAHLAGSGVERGLLGPREVPRIWSRHVLNCAAVAPLLPAGAHVVDVGSGAGLPGLVLAIARPDVRVTLVEPLLRRVTWLEEVTADLALTTVTVVRARAEELAGLGADVATARAVAALDRLAGWCFPLLRDGGVLLAVKGRSAPEELEQAQEALRALGAVRSTVRELGEGLLEEPTTVVEVQKGSSGRVRRPKAQVRRR